MAGVTATSGLHSLTNFVPSGPVAEAFLNDRTSSVKTLRGPVGGGKTVTNVFDGIFAAATVMPICRDGKIHCKDTIIGKTYGQLERNLYPTWHSWLPRDGGDWTEGEWSGGSGRFGQQRLRFEVIRDGRRVEVNYTALFAAIGELSVEQFVRGFEPSMWYLFELDQLPEGIVEQASGRLGRWPNRSMLPDGVEWGGYVRACLNAPDVDSWYYKLAEEIRPEGFREYTQPSGLSPKAENLHNLNKGYYEQKLAQNKHKPRWVKRFIKNEYAPSDDGQPVYPEYSDDIHRSRDELKPIKGLPLLLGFDQGLRRPAMVVAQRTRNTQLRVLAECVPGRMSARRFSELCKNLLKEIAPGFEIGGAWADPAGFDGADREDDEVPWAETVMHEMGIVIQQAPSNSIDLRVQSVSDELTFMIEPGVPGLILSQPRCPMLRKGFATEYCYAKQRVGNSDVFANKPDKRKPEADPHDALQYLTLGEKGRYGAISGVRSKGGLGKPTGGSVKIKSDFVSGDVW